MRRAEPAAAEPSAGDDFGFEPDLVREPVAEPASADAAPETEAPSADGEPRRRRRRRGGRGRRRSGSADGARGPAPVAEGTAAPAVRAPADTGFAADLFSDDDASADRLPWPDGPAPASERRSDADRRAAAGDDEPPPPHRRSADEVVAPLRREADEPMPQARRHAEHDSELRPRSGPPPRRSGGQFDWFSPERLEACQRAIHYHFRDVSLLENALTHSSIKAHDRPSYERLEFLGDSVIGLVIAEYLYNLLPDCDEGELTKMKSLVVSTEGLADAAKACGLDRFLAVGRGILMKNAVPRSLIADVFEGVVGAVYLDRGYETVRLYILDMLRPFIEDALSDRGRSNYKSVLQQVAQREFGDTPYYEVQREGGPEHSRVFEVLAVVGRRRFPPAREATKKEAEQAAAKLALQSILSEKPQQSRRAPRRRRSR